MPTRFNDVTNRSDDHVRPVLLDPMAAAPNDDPPAVGGAGQQVQSCIRCHDSSLSLRSAVSTRSGSSDVDQTTGWFVSLFINVSKNSLVDRADGQPEHDETEDPHCDAGSPADIAPWAQRVVEASFEDVPHAQPQGPQLTKGSMAWAVLIVRGSIVDPAAGPRGIPTIGSPATRQPAIPSKANFTRVSSRRA